MIDVRCGECIYIPLPDESIAADVDELEAYALASSVAAAAKVPVCLIAEES